MLHSGISEYEIWDNVFGFGLLDNSEMWTELFNMIGSEPINLILKNAFFKKPATL